MTPWQLVTLLGIVVLVLGILRPRRRSSGMKTSMLNEMKETLDQFAYDMEEDNKELIRLIAEQKGEQERQVERLSGRVELLEKQMVDVIQRYGSVASRMEREIEPPQPYEAEAPITYKRPKVVREKSGGGDFTRPEMTEETAAAAQAQAEPEEREAPASPQQLIKDRYKQVFDLHHAGKSIEFIAKKMGMNKGEVQLIIQLAKQEEQFRV